MSDKNSLSGRAVAGGVGVLLVVLGGSGVAYGVTFPKAAGIVMLGGSSVMALAGLGAVGAAIRDPDWLDVETRENTMTDAERREHRIENSSDAGEDDP